MCINLWNSALHQLLKLMIFLFLPHEVHQITDVIENAISKEISGADITIHPEPCSHTDNDHGKCNSSRIREGLKKLQK